jgi:ATP-binding cassette subfamily B protein
MLYHTHMMRRPSPFRQQSEEDEDLSWRERLVRFVRSVPGALAGLARSLRLVWETNPWLTLGLGLTTLLLAFVPASTIYLNKLLLDAVVIAIRESARANYYLRLIAILAGLQLLLNLVMSLLSTLSNTFQQILQDETASRVQYLLIEHAHTLDMAFFERSEFYDKLQQVQQEAMLRPVMMIAGTFSLLRNALTFGSMIVLLVRLEWWLAVIALVAPVPAFIADARYGWRGFQLRRRQSQERRMQAYLVNLLTTDSYQKEIKIFNLGPFFIERFKQFAERFLSEERRLVVRRYLAGFGWGTLTTLVSSGTFLYVAIQAIYGRVSIGDLTLYTQAANSVQNNFQNILSGFSSMYEHNLYLSTLFEVLALRPEMPRPANPVPLERPFTRGIEFRNVTFYYEGRQEPALRNVSFKLEAGQTLAIVGRNGAGKTTLVKLLARLYDPQEGQILVNGHDIREYDPDELRREIGIIFQDFVQYQLLARENIGIGQVDFIEDRARITTAAQKSGADEVIARLPQGYETMLGRWFEEGHHLSGGEWQKMALARGFMREAQILILDEPTSALDAQAEHELFARMRELTRGRIAIFISHRFSTVRVADLILVLERGEVIEQGSHEELMAHGGRYAELFNLQASSYR